MPCCSCARDCLRHSTVTLLTSSRLVMPALTFSSPDRAQVPNTFLGRLVGDVDGVAAVQ